VALAGENELQRFNGSVYAQIIHNSNFKLHGTKDKKIPDVFLHVSKDEQANVSE